MRQPSAVLIALTAVLAGSLAGCARTGHGPVPSWIEGASREYPSDQYLVGVGQADSQAVAAERAYAAVAKIFKAEVNAQSRDWESFLLFENRGQANAERRLTLDQLTRVSTDKVLENVKILDAWVNPRTGQHHALAGMNRPQAEAALLERVAELDQVVDGQIREARQIQDTLARVKNFRRAIKNLVTREVFNADLRVIRPSGRGMEPAYQVAEVTAELEQFLAGHLVIGVEVTSEQAEPVRQAVMEGLLREKLPVTDRQIGSAAASAGADGRKPLELLVRGTARLWSTDVPDPQFKYVRWCSDFVVLEIGTQRIVGAVSRGGREGHLTVGEARAKAIRVMQQELTSELARTLAGYVYGESEPPASIPPAACPRSEG